MPRYHTPLDYACPKVEEFMEQTMNDPMMKESGCGNEFLEDFEKKHRKECPRCKEFGLANIEVV